MGSGGVPGWRWLSRPLTLGSVSPFQALRGILDISFSSWRDSPLLSGARVLFLGVTIWGIATLVGNVERGIVIAGIGLLAFLALQRR